MSPLRLFAAVATLAVAACGDPNVEIPVPLAVVNVAPHDGAVDVPKFAEPTVCFNQDLELSRASGNVVLEYEGGGEVAGQSLALTPDKRCLLVKHSAPLAAGSNHVLRIRAAMSSSEDAPLGFEALYHFKTVF